MPTAVESYATLGAVLVPLPKSSGPAIHVTDSNNDAHIGGRNGAGPVAMLQKQTLAAVHSNQHHVPVHPHPVLHPFNPGSDYQHIGGRSDVGFGAEFQQHQNSPFVYANQPIQRSHVNTGHTHHPGIQLINTNMDVIGGRSGGVAISVIHQNLNHEAANRSQAELLPAVQSESEVLRPLIHDICAALQGVIPQGHKMLEAIGIGTNAHTLGVLIGLLRTQGYHVTIASCDGSVRPGFTGPTAILRAHGGSTAGLFLQQLSSVRQAA